MYQLYYAPGTCSLAVHVLLNELNQPVELTRLSLQDPRPAEFLKVNPRGNVPVLVDDGTVVREGGAILTYLADKHKSDLLPREGASRARALEWLMFANASLHPTYARSFFLKRGLPEGEAANHPLYTATIEAIQKYWDEIESELQTRPYIAGESVTLADILLTVIGSWGPWLLQPVTFGAKTQDLFKRVAAREAYKKAVASEQASLKAAA